MSLWKPHWCSEQLNLWEKEFNLVFMHLNNQVLAETRKDADTEATLSTSKLGDLGALWISESKVQIIQGLDLHQKELAMSYRPWSYIFVSTEKKAVWVEIASLTAC